MSNACCEKPENRQKVPYQHSFESFYLSYHGCQFANETSELPTDKIPSHWKQLHLLNFFSPDSYSFTVEHKAYEESWRHLFKIPQKISQNENQFSDEEKRDLDTLICPAWFLSWNQYSSWCSALPLSSLETFLKQIVRSWNRAGEHPPLVTYEFNYAFSISRYCKWKLWKHSNLGSRGAYFQKKLKGFCTSSC